MSNEEILKKYKIGTRIVITEKPKMWASILNKNNPLHSNVIYPYITTIKDIEKRYSSSFGDSISIDDGTYGWSLTCLIREDKVFILSENRKLKLNKINESR
jgi:hypothetical protein